MNRAFLFVLTLGALLLVGSGVYWLSGREQTEKSIAPLPEATEASRPAEKDMPRIETPPVSPTPDTVSDEDAPKPVSENKQKFESEEEVPDTDDTVTIEVELEEE